MQFIPNGPEVPNALLQAHEDGRVVFFCGAGVSYPAGLPSFQGLVDKIYQYSHTFKEPIEKENYDSGRFDATLDLLERRLPGKRLGLRKTLFKILKLQLRHRDALDAQAALLCLSRDRENCLRLVTTNFDRSFEYAAQRQRMSLTRYAAPMLPIPKANRWDGLVYLHGRLPERKADESALHRLVLTSGDFGLAYLTERWAARFVSELFRGFIVCFVGYSINDAVLRYMMDALASDRILGESTPMAYAFAECKPGQEEAKGIEWAAKGVTPILYNVAKGDRRHSTLHDTLKRWAEIYRDGISGKERIVTEYALAKPSQSTQEDNFVSRMLWALSDKSGKPARHFANLNPVAPLEWLDVFTENHFQHDDLNRFGVQPNKIADDKMRFSLFRRPAPYDKSPWMGPNSAEAQGGGWDDVMHHLACWLVRHLDDPKLLLWLTCGSGELNQRMLWLIEDKVKSYESLKKNKNAVSLDDTRANAPMAIPGLKMRKLLELLLSGRIKASRDGLGFYRWKERLNRYGLTASLRLELRELLTPKIALSKAYDFPELGVNKITRHRKHPVDWEVVLTGDNAYSYFYKQNDTAIWRKSLPTLIADFQQLLRDALDLRRELTESKDLVDDQSHGVLPSISHHWQNRQYRDWVLLIELVRDAWLALHKRNIEEARQVASKWFDLPYSTFKRLALFAASRDGRIGSICWVTWLLADDAKWLWHLETQREVMRLLVLQGRNLTRLTQRRLELTILKGFPRGMHGIHEKSEEWKAVEEHSIWIRLAKLQKGGAILGKRTALRLSKMKTKYPQWKLDNKHKKDEFPTWMSGNSDPDYKDSCIINKAPRKKQGVSYRRTLADWILKSPPVEKRVFNYVDDWRDICKRHPLNACYALLDLGDSQKWFIDRWVDAFSVWTELGRYRNRKIWQHIAPEINETIGVMPPEILHKVAHTFTRWLEAIASMSAQHEDVLLGLFRRMLSLPYTEYTNVARPVTDAINHPVGFITEGLLNTWFGRKPKDSDGIPADIEPFFTQFCISEESKFRHARVILASRLIALFRIDRNWTKEHLLPFFSWTVNPETAKSVWNGFLWSPRIYSELFLTFKVQFLETSKHYKHLESRSSQYVALLTYAALELKDGYTDNDYRGAIEALPQDGLEEVASALCRTLESVPQRENYWTNRILPFWNRIWPKSERRVSSAIVSSLSCLCIAAREKFPSALDAVYGFLRKFNHPDIVLLKLDKSGLCRKFPAQALQLLDAVLPDSHSPYSNLRSCLDEIAQGNPKLRNDRRYKKLQRSQ